MARFVEFELADGGVVLIAVEAIKSVVAGERGKACKINYDGRVATVRDTYADVAQRVIEAAEEYEAEPPRRTVQGFSLFAPQAQAQEDSR